MQTFLPYASFEESAKCLDDKRLGKQRVEAMQILRTLRGESKGWKNHPAVKMWKGYENALEQYLRAMIVEWVNRGFANSIPIPKVKFYKAPYWFGKVMFHKSHQSNLLRKDPKYYGEFNWKVKSNLPYVWPTKDKV